MNTGMILFIFETQVPIFGLDAMHNGNKEREELIMQRVKDGILEILTYSMPMWFLAIMFLHWFRFGY